jgi:hypothetical protein
MGRNKWSLRSKDILLDLDKNNYSFDMHGIKSIKILLDRKRFSIDIIIYWSNHKAQ